MRLAKDIKSRLAERLVSLLVALATNMIFARELGPTSYGALAFVLATSSVLGPIAKFGIGGRLTVALLKDPANSEQLTDAAITWRLLGGVLAILVTLTLTFFAPTLPSTPSVLVMCICQSLAIYSVLEFRFDSSLRAAKLLLPRISMLFAFAAIKCVAVLSGGSVLTVVLLIALELLFGSLVTLAVYYREFAHFPKPARFSAGVAAFGPGTVWLVTSGLMEIVYLKVDIFILKFFESDAQIGIYSVAARIAELAFVLPPLMATPILSGALQSRRSTLMSHRAARGFGTLLFFLGISTSLMLLILSPLLPLALGNEYRSSSGILAVYCWCVPFIFLRALLSRLLILRDLLRFSLYTTVIGAILNVIINIILIPAFGLYGAAIATVISYSAAGWLSLYCFSGTQDLARLLTRSIFSTFDRRGILTAIAFVRAASRRSRA
jgi:O-antigen/teichoic acid export membrane protein